MSAGTVRGKSAFAKPNNQNPKSMSSSFFLYKIHAQDAMRREGIQKRQSKTSGGTRGRPNNI